MLNIFRTIIYLIWCWISPKDFDRISLLPLGVLSHLPTYPYYNYETGYEYTEGMKEDVRDDIFIRRKWVLSTSLVTIIGETYEIVSFQFLL